MKIFCILGRVIIFEKSCAYEDGSAATVLCRYKMI
jgi:hypothetical protein